MSPTNAPTVTLTPEPMLALSRTTTNVPAEHYAYSLSFTPSNESTETILAPTSVTNLPTECCIHSLSFALSNAPEVKNFSSVLLALINTPTKTPP